MTLRESLLPKLSEWRPAGAGRHSWASSFPTHGWTVSLAADRADSLACLVWEVSLARSADPPAGLTLKAWAEAIAGRVSGLTEPLSVYEVDDLRGEAILRSKSPSRRDEELTYFEVRLVGLRSAIIRRFAAARNATGRTQISFAITHEALAKLADDVAG
jgi:hypothetical protein